MTIDNFPSSEFERRLWDMRANGWLGLKGCVISIHRKVPISYIDPRDVEKHRPTGMIVWTAKIAPSKVG
jgi:hypothetical protein